MYPVWFPVNQIETQRPILDAPRQELTYIACHYESSFTKVGIRQQLNPIQGATQSCMVKTMPSSG